MAACTEAFIGIDVAKLRNAVAIAEVGRDGEICSLGEVDAFPESMGWGLAKSASTEDDARDDA